MKSDIIKLTDKILVSDGCWEWLGSKLPSGYGRLAWRRSWWLAHRASYTYFIGPLPKGLTIDHLCRNRACVKPSHLQPVTLQENVLRGTALPAENARKTHCKRGHLLTGNNLSHRKQRGRLGRVCVECRNARQRKYNASLSPAGG